MAVVVLYDLGTDRVLQHLRGANTPDYDVLPNALINPDLSLLDGIVPLKYWKHSAGAVVEMTAPEKSQVDTDETTALNTGNRAFVVAEIDAQTQLGVRIRALVDDYSKRLNYTINRVRELQEDLQAIKASNGPADNIRAAIRVSYLATNNRSKTAALQDIKDDINAGNQDT